MMKAGEIFRYLQKKFVRRPILPLSRKHRKLISIDSSANFGFPGGMIEITVPFDTNAAESAGGDFSLYDSLGKDLKKYTCVCIQVAGAEEQYLWWLRSIGIAKYENQN